MTMIAYVFLQHRRLTKAGREKKNRRPPASAKPAGRASRHRQSFDRRLNDARIAEMDRRTKAA